MCFYSDTDNHDPSFNNALKRCEQQRPSHDVSHLVGGKKYLNVVHAEEKVKFESTSRRGKVSACYITDRFRYNTA